MLAESRCLVKSGNMYKAEWTFEGEQKRQRSMRDGSILREQDQHMSVCVEVDIFGYQARWHRRNITSCPSIV